MEMNVTITHNVECGIDGFKDMEEDFMRLAKEEVRKALDDIDDDYDLGEPW